MAPATLSGDSMPSRIKAFFSLSKWILLSLWLAGCYKNHLYVQQERVDPTFLASSRIGTPDPRQERPPQGQRLLIAWHFPRSLFQRHLSLVATVRLWDQTEEVFTYPVEKKWGSTALYFSNDCAGVDRRILTYRVQVVARDGEVVEVWEHHFWTHLIDIDREK